MGFSHTSAEQVDPLGLQEGGNNPCHSGYVWTGSGCAPAGGGGPGQGHQPLQDALAGGGGGKRRLPKKLQDALARCLSKLFQITLTSFEPSAIGQNGSFSGTGANGQQFDLNNDATTFSVADLNMIFFGSTEPPAGRSDIQGLTLEGRQVTKYFLKYIPDYFSLRSEVLK